MTEARLLSELLQLKECRITRYEFKRGDTELHLTVKPYKNGCRCPHCQRRCRIVGQAVRSRSWEGVSILGMRVFLRYAPREIECPTHGRVQEQIPWPGRGAIARA